MKSSASTCKLTRERLVLFDELKHSIQHRCLAHLVNRIGNHITTSECILQIFQAASRLAREVNNSSRRLAIVRNARELLRLAQFAGIQLFG